MGEIEDLKKVIEGLKQQSGQHFHAQRFIILPLHVAAILGGKALLAQNPFMTLRSFSILGMVLTIMCLVADLVCYGQYLAATNKPWIRKPTARNPLFKMLQFIFSNVIFRVTTWVTVWYLASFAYLFGLFEYQRGALPEQFRDLYSLVMGIM